LSGVPSSAPLLLLVKHAQPVLDAARPPRDWDLAGEGEDQAERLADALRQYLPFQIVSSPELKARRTTDIVAARLGITTTTAEDLRELDRPVLPILSRGGHEAMNARVFEDFDRPVIGRESAAAALHRFDVAVRQRVGPPIEHNVVVIAHGTVISLFVASANPSIDAFALWKRLRCPSYVILDQASLALREVVDDVQVRT
jgi:broad specificity phosphatase PhoE